MEDNNNINQNANPAAGQAIGERTFTQEQVNAIVGKRLAEAKASNEAALSKREAELNRRELQIRARELLAERGLPKNLADVLRYEDEESLKAAINVIEHTRGFKENEPPQRRITPNVLPKGGNNVDGDPLRQAMGLK